MDENSRIFILRWSTRSLLTLMEIGLIGYVVYLIFGGGELAKDMQNALSVVLGGLILNFGKSSSYWFSNESETNNGNNNNGNNTT
jgi:hypothetical protein